LQLEAQLQENKSLEVNWGVNRRTLKQRIKVKEANTFRDRNWLKSEVNLKKLKVWKLIEDEIGDIQD
jgi:hypothetical protein